MPLVMLAGGLLHNWLGRLGWMTPYLIFAMLFIPFCGVRLREIRVSGMHLNLLLFQAVAGVLVYIFVRPFDVDVAQGAMICVFAPTATAAVVIASMLGARVATMLSYSLLINFAAAVGLPLFFTIVVPSAGVSFLESFATILWRVMRVLALPFVAAMVLRRFVPRAADVVHRMSGVSFYLWLTALSVTTASVVNFVATQRGLTVRKGVVLGVVALVLCVVQFFAGRRIGVRYGETVAGGQSLGQKNTVLAIWLAQTYLNPVSSIAPAAYVLWQTIFNSIQLWRSSRKNSSPS
ncbi:MAG: transporter [Alistipes sp.]|jgi:BASS family bile acid:Na+ symporter|nr:transporter [Alistipes sp.]